MTAGTAQARGPVRRNARLLAQAIEYEVRKVSVFRVGFLVREVGRGVVHPIVMICIYLAIFRSSSAETIRGFSFRELVQYLILVATFHKVVFHERVLDLSVQIFEGYFTKYLVMPFRFFILPLARWVQYTVVQVVIAAAFYAVGALAFPSIWPAPASFSAAVQAGVLVLLGSFCFLEVFFILNVLAFWLDVIWSLLVMSRFVTNFIAGVVIPVSMMPDAMGAVFRWTFPYWTISAPIELFLGRLDGGDFREGLVVLLATVLVLEVLRRVVWRRGTRRYSGSGM